MSSSKKWDIIQSPGEFTSEWGWEEQLSKMMTMVEISTSCYRTQSKDTGPSGVPARLPGEDALQAKSWQMSWCVPRGKNKQAFQTEEIISMS